MITALKHFPRSRHKRLRHPLGRLIRRMGHRLPTEHVHTCTHYFLRAPAKFGARHRLQPLVPYLHLEQPNLSFFTCLPSSVLVSAAAGRLSAGVAAAGRFKTAGASSTLVDASRSKRATTSSAGSALGAVVHAASELVCESDAAASPIANIGVILTGGTNTLPGMAHAAEAPRCCPTCNGALIGEVAPKSWL